MKEKKQSEFFLECLPSFQRGPTKRFQVTLAFLVHNRYGKPFVMDMMEVDMFETVADRFDEIKKGLMNDIMDRSILQEEK